MERVDSERRRPLSTVHSSTFPTHRTGSPRRARAVAAGGGGGLGGLLLELLELGVVGVAAEVTRLELAVGVHQQGVALALGVAGHVDERPAGGEVDVAVLAADRVAGRDLEDLRAQLAAGAVEDLDLGALAAERRAHDPEVAQRADGDRLAPLAGLARELELLRELGGLGEVGGVPDGALDLVGDAVAVRLAGLDAVVVGPADGVGNVARVELAGRDGEVGRDGLLAGLRLLLLLSLAFVS